MKVVSEGFSDQVTEDKFTKLFRECIRNLNINPNQDNDEIRVMSGGILGITRLKDHNIDNKEVLLLVVPSIKYDNEQNMYKIKYIGHVIHKTETYTEPELKFLLYHELFHYVNGDLSNNDKVKLYVYNCTSAAIWLMAYSTIVRPKRWKIPTSLGMLIFNHLVSENDRMYEIRADIMASRQLCKDLSQSDIYPDPNKSGKEISVSSIEKLENSVNGDKKSISRNFIDIFFSILEGRKTHPDLKTRIDYINNNEQMFT